MLNCNHKFTFRTSFCEKDNTRSTSKDLYHDDNETCVSGWGLLQAEISINMLSEENVPEHAKLTQVQLNQDHANFGEAYCFMLLTIFRKILKLLCLLHGFRFFSGESVNIE